MDDDGSYLREKLRGAKASIVEGSSPMPKRLEYAFLSLSLLEEDHFPDDEGRNEWLGICDALTVFGEAKDGHGDMPTTLELIDEAEMLRLAERIVQLGNRYPAPSTPSA